ncbi:MAG TPA: peptidoglycan DD-metalloendopeptidase family protein [Casimicrobiaceae bacterium]|nr:peptidoglycan DD-metalloendopeptidase family protein [Casimicrobiaceae bacterium]
MAATLIALLAACATRRPAPVEERTRLPAPPPIGQVPSAPGAPGAAAVEGRVPTYTVKKGDTLYQIALDNGLDYRDLAAWNMIDNVNRIRVGQVLRLTPPGETIAAAPSNVAPAPAPEGVVTAPLRTAPPVSEARPGPAPPTVAHAAPSTVPGNLKSSPKAVKEPYSERAVRELQLAASAGPAPPAVTETVAEAAAQKAETRPEPARAAASDDNADDRLDWVWPAKGKVISGFSDSANLKGIDISGNAGDPVYASAAGKVVYAGNGLRGYGKLVIIKHNKTYLSAYAHNREILVKEGQQVAKGQKIAEMGNSDADQVKLHFEIRRLGRPMDPTRFLPSG